MSSQGVTHDTPEEQQSSPPVDVDDVNVQEDQPAVLSPSLQADLQLLGPISDSLRFQLILQDRQAQREAEDKRSQREAEDKRAEREAEDKRAERQYQLELAKIQLQQGRPAGNAEPREEQMPKVSLDKFPTMDKDGDMDTFLQGFERTCRQYCLPKEQWAQYLTPGLKGKALDVLLSLPEGQERDYEAVKQAIVKRYQLTPDVYRKRFRTLHRGPNDSYLDLAYSLRTAFRQWLKGLSISTFDALQELMVKDQFLWTCPSEVRQFVLDRDPKTADQAAEIADAYTANRMSDTRRITAPSGKGERAGGPSSQDSYKTKPPGSPGAKPKGMDTRKCFVCNQVGHLSVSCPERKKSAPSTKPPSPEPAVLCASRTARGPSDNLQPVMVGDKVTTGLRDSGAEVTLVHPEVLKPEDLIPGMTMTVKGVGGINLAIATAWVYLDWGAGRGMRQVGVTDAIPANVLLGTDLGRLVARYETYSAPVETASPPDAPDSRKVLLGDPVHIGNSGEGQGANDCVPGLGPSGSLKPRPREELKAKMNSDTDNVLCDVKCHDLCHADLPSAAVVTPGAHRSALEWSLPTATKEWSGEGVDPMGLDSCELGQVGRRSPHSVVSLASVADLSESPKAVKIDISLEEYRGLADRLPAGDGGRKVYGEQNCDSVITCEGN